MKTDKLAFEVLAAPQERQSGAPGDWSRSWAAPWIYGLIAALALALTNPPAAYSLAASRAPRIGQAHATASGSGSGLSQHRTVKAKHLPASQAAPQKTRSVEKDSVRPAVPEEERPAKHVAHPVTRPSRKAMA